jgi:hypothetical protein
MPPSSSVENGEGSVSAGGGFPKTNRWSKCAGEDTEKNATFSKIAP